jgi:ribosomal protein S27AE
VLEITAEPVFVAAPEIIDWATELFIQSGADLYNEDHKHLNFASIGALWTNVHNGRAGRRVVGQAEMGLPPVNKWAAGRIEMQLNAWFGHVPDFLLTFHAEYCSECSDAEFMALVEHELYHCGQAKDIFGTPRFSKMTGRPIFAMRGHDVEEFVGVVRRYGADAAGVREMVEAAKRQPEISAVKIAQGCGTCHLKAA